MDKKIGKRWIKRLRGETKTRYKQGREYLRKRAYGQKVDRFCCLGVLCDMLKRPVESRTLDDGSIVYAYDRQTGLPADVVLEQAGLTLNQIGFLADMNDDGASFKKIANFIERELL